jgi:hypothetical protein
VWEARYGIPFPDGMDAAHTCGNGDLACVNHRHLFPATRRENMEHARQHGTLMVGTRSATVVLSEDDVRLIRKLWATGAVQKVALARRFGVSERTIYGIVRGETWQHI